MSFVPKTAAYSGKINPVLHSDRIAVRIAKKRLVFREEFKIGDTQPEPDRRRDFGNFADPAVISINCNISTVGGMRETSTKSVGFNSYFKFSAIVSINLFNSLATDS